MRKIIPLLAIAFIVLASAWGASQYYGPRLLSLLSGNTSSTDTEKTENNTTSTGPVSVNVLVRFENGTRRWFNETIVPYTYNFYIVTYQISNGDIVAARNPYLNSSYVFKIFGEGCEPPDPTKCGGYWSLWLWNETSHCWAYSHFGIDLVNVNDFKMIAWHFTNFEHPSEPVGRC